MTDLQPVVELPQLERRPTPTAGPLDTANAASDIPGLTPELARYLETIERQQIGPVMNADGTVNVNAAVTTATRPWERMQNTFAKDELDALNNLADQYGVIRENQENQRTRNQGEIEVAGDEAFGAIGGVIDSATVRQGALASRQSNDVGLINDSRARANDAVLAAVQASGGNVDRVGESIITGNNRVAREQAAGATHLAGLQDIGQTVLADLQGSGALIEQSSLSQLTNNFTAAQDQLRLQELEQQGAIEAEYAAQRRELDQRIAEIAIQVRQQAEAQNLSVAAARAAGARRGGGGGGFRRGGGGGSAPDADKIAAIIRQAERLGTDPDAAIDAYLISGDVGVRGWLADDRDFVEGQWLDANEPDPLDPFYQIGGGSVLDGSTGGYLDPNSAYFVPDPVERAAIEAGASEAEANIAGAGSDVFDAIERLVSGGGGGGGGGERRDRLFR